MARLGRSSFEQARTTQDLAVPWEKDLPPEKRRYDVRFIRGGPGKSGMGIVYLAYDREHDAPYAIKTFQDRFLGSPRAVENFKKEAQVWVELGKHKNIVKAIGVEINLGRPYIFLEMVAGDELYGVDLSGWIRGKGLDLSLMVNFAIQFCRGMSHAEQRFKEMGRVFVHRDIKPENIMVTRDKVVKVTDFGLVHVVRDQVFDPESIGDDAYGRFSVVSQHGICGTPFYMSPEQVLQGAELLMQLGIVNATPEVPLLDLRSDMYAFGCVLYEMVTAQPPFQKFPFDRRDYARYFSQTLYDEPETVASGDKEFDDLTMRLLRKSPEKRGYRSFAELEETLQGIHVRLTGECLKEECFEEIRAWELSDRGLSFDNLGLYERAIAEYDKAITLNPGYAKAYSNRGLAYDHLGQSERAFADYNQALTLNPGEAVTYLNRGGAYADLGQFERAIADYDKAITLNPGYANAYCNRGSIYADLGQFEQAIADYDKAITLNPGYANAYCNRGTAYADLGQFEQAIAEYDKALTLNPGLVAAYANRGTAYAQLGQFERAIEDYSRFVELAPPQYAQHIIVVKERIRQLEAQIQRKKKKWGKWLKYIKH